MDKIWYKLPFFLLTILVFSLLGCKQQVGKNEEEEEPLPPPNIIFLLADDQRYDALGVAGNEVIQTPNLDKLANEGVYFTNGFVTTSICAVSRASIFTGQYARRHEIWGFAKNFSEEQWENSYPMQLKKAGYSTGFIGKFGVGNFLPAEDFDYWKGFGGQGSFKAQDVEGNPIHLTELIGNQITEFIALQKDSAKPFHLSVSFKAPHVEGDPGYFLPNETYSGLYQDNEITPPVSSDLKYFNYFPDDFTNNNVARNRWNDRFSSPEKYQENVKKYYQLIYGVDVVVGRIRETLKQNGLDDNTIIIYSSDNGFYLGEYGFAGKWYGSEASIRVPIIVFDPREGRPKSTSVSGIALNIDIAPTILNLAGIAPPAAMQGRNLHQLIKGAPDWRKEFFYEHLWQSSNAYYIPSTEGYVGERYKYMKYFMNFDENDVVFEELYDLEEDPHEINNLVMDDPELKQKVIQKYQLAKAHAE